MKILKVLEHLEHLLASWHIRTSDWILVSQYAYRLLGYKVKLRKGHFNILVRRNVIPWKINEGVEIHPPRNSGFRLDFKNFIDKTGFDFDLNLASNEEFADKKGKFVDYILPNNITIQVQKPVGAVREFEKLLSLSTDRGFGVERLTKDIIYIKDMIRVLDKKGETETLSEFKKLLGKYLKTQKRKLKKSGIHKTEVSGIVASKGKVKGRAIVAKSEDDLKKVLKGQVLVAEMTTPYCTPFLPNVSAIVTDKGGQLSHAAILAREMKIPCIVGTVVATKRIKTGDLVEVDANRGLVRKLADPL